jgi:hypothetical protein
MQLTGQLACIVLNALRALVPGWVSEAAVKACMSASRWSPQITTIGTQASRMLCQADPFVVPIALQATVYLARRLSR